MAVGQLVDIPVNALFTLTSQKKDISLSAKVCTRVVHAHEECGARTRRVTFQLHETIFIFVSRQTVLQGFNLQNTVKAMWTNVPALVSNTLKPLTFGSLLSKMDNGEPCMHIGTFTGKVT